MSKYETRCWSKLGAYIYIRDNYPEKRCLALTLYIILSRIRVGYAILLTKAGVAK